MVRNILRLVVRERGLVRESIFLNLFSFSFFFQEGAADGVFGSRVGVLVGVSVV